MKYTRSDFPDSFLFGLTATEIGPELQTIGFDSFRFPVRWAEILPHGRGKPDAAAMDRYAGLIDSVLDCGLRPCAVLDPDPLPPDLLDIGGWRNRDIAKRFADFAEITAARLGDRLFGIATGSATGQTAPTDKRALTRGIHHRLLANSCAIQAMRAIGVRNIGVEFDLNSPNATTFAHAIFQMAYPAEFLTALGEHLPAGYENDVLAITGETDWYSLRIRASEDLQALRPFSVDLPIYLTLDTDDTTDLSTCVEQIHDTINPSLPFAGLFLPTPSDKSLESLRATLNSDQPAPWVPSTGAVHDHWNLVADIGGTNTRLGVVTNGELTELYKFPTGRLADLRTALHSVRDTVGTDPRAVVAAGAGPVRDGIIHLTNADLALSEAELARTTGAKRTFVINDFTAAAWSVADVTSADVAVLQGADTPPAGTRLVVGPGTGLGVGALLYSEGHYHTVSGEGGHMGLSPRHRDEVDVFDAARRIAPECFFADSLAMEAEMFLSGTGLPILYQAVGMAGGQTDTPVRSARDILEDARDGNDAIAVKTARMFTEHLGAIMGDLSVALIPTGGVFLVGGVAEKNRWLFDQDFLNAFNAGGRFDDLRRGMSLYVSELDEFGIIGANNFCKNALAR